MLLVGRLTEWSAQAEVRLDLGAVLELLGQWDRAEECYQEALALSEQARDGPEMARCHKALGSLLGQRGDFDVAQGLLDATGGALEGNERREYEHMIATLRAALGEEAFAASWAQGQAMEMDQAVASTLSIV